MLDIRCKICNGCDPLVRSTVTYFDRSLNVIEKKIAQSLHANYRYGAYKKNRIIINSIC